MNEFLQQFLIESRELIEQATDGLLILERSPHDAERLDAVFRAFHTLKGGAGIVDFAAMERAVHAAEGVLSQARSGSRALTPALVGDCLACLDQVLQWLDTMEQTGELPPPTCEAEADRVIARFSVAAAKTDPAAASTVAAAGVSDAWLELLLERHSQLRSQARAAMRFVPDAECFFRNEDPIARVTSLPGLLSLDVEPVSAWPALGELDPFRCNLVLIALTSSSVRDATEHMKGHSGLCDIREVSGAAGEMSDDAALPLRAHKILVAQLDLLRDVGPGQYFGHVASAGVTAANVMRFCGRPSDAELLSRATEVSLARGAAGPLMDAITKVMSQQSVAGANPVASAVSADPIVPAESPRTETSPRTLRVDAERIDSLVRLTGELTVAKNAVGHLAKLAQVEANSLAGALKERHAVLEHLVGELQRSVLGMRVLPLRTVFQRFPRVLREMSASLGKPATLKIIGEDTEADKAIIEMLFEPLLHVVRNALDHGVESPAQRAERGKPVVATIEMRATRQGEHVLIEVVDDGGGLNIERIREVARARGVATEEVLRAMSDSDVTDLVFAPGFSTATEVTELSGRGVGMDAVRTAVQRVGGRVAIESRAGQGATFRFTLPFSVMMTHVMTVEAGGQMFGIPLDAIVETLRVPRTAIAGVGAAHAIVVRDRTVPVLELANVLGVGAAGEDANDVILVITAVAGQACGIHVDRLGERIEVILKPLEGLLSGTPGITGTTLLGDGRVLLVLDVGALLQ